MPLHKHFVKLKLTMQYAWMLQTSLSCELRISASFIMHRHHHHQHQHHLFSIAKSTINIQHPNNSTSHTARLVKLHHQSLRMMRMHQTCTKHHANKFKLR